jgi:hypothetical protein
VVYAADQETDEVVELWSAPLAGGASRKLSGPMVGGGDVRSYALTPDGATAVYSADQDLDEVIEFYRAPVGTAAVEIAVRPGEHPKVVNPRSRGHLPVAVYGSAEIDVTAIDLAKLALGPGFASPVKAPFYADLDDDGFTDLLLRFRTPALGIERGDTQLCLSGERDGGCAFRACAAIATPGGAR